MSPGLSRRQALRQLTREVPVDPFNPAAGINAPIYVPLNGHIYSLALSADGGRIAFASARQRFPLAPPNLIGAPPVSVGLVELYLIDVEGETLQRVTHGFGGVGEASLASGGSPTNGDGASTPSLDAAGNLIGFASSASNLVQGDGNESSDVFLVGDDAVATGAGASAISPAPGLRLSKRPWRLTVSARSLPSGLVRLVAMVPGAGTLHAAAGASLQAGRP